MVCPVFERQPVAAITPDLDPDSRRPGRRGRFQDADRIAELSQNDIR